jgi:ribosomal protein S18 acetylase RimI-like enzyme
VSVVERIRDAELDEVWALESLRRRSSSVWDADRDRLPPRDAVELPPDAIRERRVRVAVVPQARRVGFSVMLPIRGRVCELDGLFVDPEFARRGVGRLLVADVLERARSAEATRLDVIADPRAAGFYERVGFRPAGQVTTRLGPALRMRAPILPRRVEAGGRGP